MPDGDGVLVCCMLDTVSVLNPPGCARARLRKLMYRVVFPFELKLRNVADECDDADDVFHLFAVVVHVGSGLNHGASEGPVWACAFLQMIAVHVGSEPNQNMWWGH